MEFLAWWFDGSPVLSTLFTPTFGLLWSIYNDYAGRAVWCAISIAVWTAARAA